MKIPKNVSGLRQKFAQARAERKRTPIVPEKKTAPDDRVKKARDEAIASRRKLREKETAEAEKDLRIQELEAALNEAKAKNEEYEPAAKRWNDFDHKRKERLIAKFPKEEQSRVRKFDSEAIEALAEARGFMGEGAAAGNGQAGGKKVLFRERWTISPRLTPKRTTKLWTA